ncbi:MAG: DUF3153 domain-containing protein [Okeania sp. SIO3B5]|uniref:DUF3153 domain-containing protein n=1 Tax=Okeania sp. SIO3B5 TaxID=2607811 RepID=UPI0013FFCF4E|nr:DUF3153 domain-containing protein [Okeania sp. SIO3B5]NEO56089.1 DUF3153 domain-containing protein [Okeania sp. SIO3B5]
MKVLKVILISFLAVLLLNGCVKYEVGINFESQNHGEIVQHIKLADELKNFSRKIVSEWLRSIDTRVSQLQGKTQKISSQEILVTIPFNNGAELEEKFNQFFKPIDAQESDNYGADITEDLPKLESQIEVSQNNLFLALRNRLSINLDLQLSTSNSKVIVNPSELLGLEFQLTTPWGFSNIEATENDAITYLSDRQIVWKLNTGESNSLDVVFWIPSPIGIGAILIGLFVYLGIALKYQVLPALGIIKK